MDSMKSLNTSLPRSSPCPQPTEQLLQSFKTAALSVTTLYKNAVHEQSHARHLGYQDAIEDLLSFLDKEHLGFGDGEAWNVRQWATEKRDGTGSPPDDDDERENAEKRTRSTSPMASRKEQPDPDTVRQSSGPASPPREEQHALQQQQQQQQQQQLAPSTTTTTATTTTTPQTNETNAFSRPAIFTFTAGQQFPQQHEQDIDMQGANDSSSQDDAAVNISVLPPRNSRPVHRHNNQARSNQRASTREPSVGLGSKRKFTFPDFFDLSGLGNGRDVFGGGKRGRFT